MFTLAHRRLSQRYMRRDHHTQNSFSYPSHNDGRHSPHHKNSASETSGSHIIPAALSDNICNAIEPAISVEQSSNISIVIDLDFKIFSAFF